MFRSNAPSPVSLSGVSLHSGVKSTITFRPSSGDGIFFVYNGKRIPALAEFVTDTTRGTTLGDVSVVEHVLSAAAGLNIYSLEIELSHPEPPAMDGSALPFAEALQKSGFKKTAQKVFILDERIKLADGDAVIEAVPYPGFAVDFTIDFPSIGGQRFIYEDNYLKEIAPARTFGFVEELDELKKRELAKGASLDTALALNSKGYVNKPRFENEPVRHKILDLIGDLALVGAPIRAKIMAVKSGHKLNIELSKRIRKLMLDRETSG